MGGARDRRGPCHQRATTSPARPSNAGHPVLPPPPPPLEGAAVTVMATDAAAETPAALLQVNVYVAVPTAVGVTT